MIMQFDMASCELILDPETDCPQAAAVEPQVALRLQTVAEAIASQTQAGHAMPADLLQVDPAVFIASQE